MGIKKSCFHKGVCKFLVEDMDKAPNECDIIEVCKFYVGYEFGKKRAGGGSDAKPKRHYTRRAKPDIDSDDEVSIECDITEKQFKKARKKIANAKQNGKLNENQLLALKSLKGIYFKTATPAQKEQVINLSNDI